MTLGEIPAIKTIILKKDIIEGLYLKYNHREYIHPDPLEFLYIWNEDKEREIVGLIASSLAYGRVSQILKSVSFVLEKMKPSPLAFIKSNSFKNYNELFGNFKHRFTKGSELSDFFYGIKKIIEEYGSLLNCFSSCYNEKDSNILPALNKFSKILMGPSNFCRNSLCASPEDGSACKRFNLYLRWMIRKDEVDPGCWAILPQSKLIIPLDTHMFSICRTLGLTLQKTANLKAAVEITNAFKEISPEDPVKYDFCLTRLGINPDDDSKVILSRLFQNLKK